RTADHQPRHRVRPDRRRGVVRLQRAAVTDGGGEEISMRKMTMAAAAAATLWAGLAQAQPAGSAQPPAAGPSVVRGVVTKIDDTSITVKGDKGLQKVGLA